MGRLGLGLVLVLRQGLGLVLGLQLRIGIGFRRNHSWSSTFTPRRNHSLCLFVMLRSSVFLTSLHGLQLMSNIVFTCLCVIVCEESIIEVRTVKRHDNT